jgi:hypothetical protein
LPEIRRKAATRRRRPARTRVAVRSLGRGITVMVKFDPGVLWPAGPSWVIRRLRCRVAGPGRLVPEIR